MNTLTAKLNNGRTVSAKLFEGEPVPKHFANRTQANKEAEKLGAGWAVCRFAGRAFYVATVEETISTNFKK